MIKKIQIIFKAILKFLFGIYLLGAWVFYSNNHASFNTISSLKPQTFFENLLTYTGDILWQFFGIMAVFIPIFLIQRSYYTLKERPSSKRRIYALVALIIWGDWLGSQLNFPMKLEKLTSVKSGGYFGFYTYQLFPIQNWITISLSILGNLILVFYIFRIPLGKVGKGITKTFYLFFKVLEGLLKIKLFKKREDEKIEKVKERKEPFFTKEKNIKEKKTELKEPIDKKNNQILEKRKSNFILPSSSLLNPIPAQEGSKISSEMMKKISGALEDVLKQFGVNGKIVNAKPGPVVTLYEFEPASGVKTSRVIALADDIAREMRVVSVRIAVVPGSNVIGIELPNPHRETVYIREMTEDTKFLGYAATLPLILGKDIGGASVFADLAKMPHLLIAGTTGSGKSVAINTMILSLLYKWTPEECKMIMIDPKMLELSVYNDIPHLLTPVVTDSGKAVVALKWAVKEMEDRYRAMSHLGVRNIDGYNQKLLQAQKNNQKLTRSVQSLNEEGLPIILEQEIDLKPMPYIVIVVDEMADLMLVAGKEVEATIQRLAQMARAAGIHLIMATQRPSVDVITGTIKANFPTRISFQVTSKIDSRTILGEQGAEQLLGRGDMLYMAAGQRPKRIHGPFVGDDEIEKVVKYLLSQGKAQYLETVLKEPENSETGNLNSSEGNDLYDQAVAIVLKDKKVSISYVQRQLRIGYNKAADLIEQMEREGVISKPNISGKREILVGED